MNTRWCGVTSAVTRMPSAFARRTSSTERADDRWQMWSRVPVMRAIARSRATMTSSASAGWPRKPERVRVEALVHLPVLDERRVLAVIGDHDIVERLRVDERVAKQPRGGHALPVVAEHPDAGLHHLADLGERLALEPLRDGAHREDVAEAGRGRQVADLVDRRRRGRRRDRCSPSARPRCSRRPPPRACPSRSSPCARSPARADACACPPGRAPGSARRSRSTSASASPACRRRPRPARPRRGRRGPRPSRRPGRPPVPPRNSTRSLIACSPRSSPPSSRYSSAIRTAIPFVTCSSITLWGRSATSESISTPRFIGPGCMISAPSGSMADPFVRDTEQPRVLADAREELEALPLPLHAEHVAHVQLRQHALDVVVTCTPHAGASGGISVGGPTSVTSAPIFTRPKLTASARRASA